MSGEAAGRVIANGIVAILVAGLCYGSFRLFEGRWASWPWLLWWLLTSFIFSSFMDWWRKRRARRGE